MSSSLMPGGKGRSLMPLLTGVAGFFSTKGDAGGEMSKSSSRTSLGPAGGRGKGGRVGNGGGLATSGGGGSSCLGGETAGRDSSMSTERSTESFCPLDKTLASSTALSCSSCGVSAWGSCISWELMVFEDTELSESSPALGGGQLFTVSGSFVGVSFRLIRVSI